MSWFCCFRKKKQKTTKKTTKCVHFESDLQKPLNQQHDDWIDYDNDLFQVSIDSNATTVDNMIVNPNVVTVKNTLH